MKKLKIKNWISTKSYILSLIFLIIGTLILIIGISSFGVINAKNIEDEKRNNFLQKEIDIKSEKFEVINKNYDVIKKEYDDIQEKLKNYNENKEKINGLQKQQEELDKKVKDKQSELDTLTANIVKETGKAVKLNAGSGYVVGQHLPSNRYQITGESNCFVTNSFGKLKVNTILNYGPYNVTLEKGDKIELSGFATFTPINK